MTKEKTSSTENQVLFRILDANFNRVREGLRVLEDLGRFYLCDGGFSRKIKSLRHDLVQNFLKLPIDRAGLLASRQSDRDSGAKLYPKTEGRRKNLPEILEVNFKRVQEGLRSLEEFSKPLASRIGQKFKGLRFQVYHLEKITILPLLVSVQQPLRQNAKKTSKK